MRTIDWSPADGTILEFLVHQQLSLGVTEPRRASLARAVTALAGAGVITDDNLDAAFLAYLTSNQIWIDDTDTANQILSHGATHGVKFRSDLIGGSPISRQVWAPRSAGVPAIDITPTGVFNTDYVPTTGRLGWHEFCSRDFLGAESGGVAFHSMRLSVDEPSVLGRGGSIGTHVFNGETIPQPWELMASGLSVGRVSDPEGTLYMIGGFRSGTYTIADGAAQAIDVPAAADPKWATLHISRNSVSTPAPWGMLRIRAGTGATAPEAISLIGVTVGTDLLFGTGILSGSTTPVGGVASAGKLAITTHTDGKVYIQNRLGGGIIIGTQWTPQ